MTNPESVEDSEVASRIASNAKNLSGDKKSRQSMKKEKRSLQAVEMKVATFSDERLCKAQLTFKEARTSSNFNNMSSESQLDSVKERQSMKSLLRAR